MDRNSLVRACAGLTLAACALVPQLVAQDTQPSPSAGRTAASAKAPMQDKEYDLLLKGGHVIDPKNKVDAVRDVAIKDGKIAKIAVGIPADT